MIEFTCTCGREYRFKDEMAGRGGKCKECGAAIHIPEKEELKDYFEALVREHFRNDKTFFAGDIPEKELRRALAGYAKTMQSTEKPVALSRQDFLGRLFRKGWLFTNWAVYYQNVWERGAFRYIDVKEFEEKVETVHTRGVSTTSHRFLTVDVVLKNGKRHKFDGSTLPLFQAMTSISPGAPAPDRAAIRVPQRAAEKQVSGQTSILRILVIGCIVGGLGGLVVALLLAMGVFRHEKAPYEATIIFFFLAVLFGFTGRTKYACGECGQPVAHSEHFCPKCKCVFR